MPIRNFSAHLEEGGGERRGPERLSFLLPFVSLLPPHLALPLLPLHLPAPTSLSQSGVYHSDWIRAPYLDADLSFLCTATGERKTLNPCLLASLPFPCTHIHIHTHSHTHLCLFAFSQPRKEIAVLSLSLNAATGRLEGSKPTLAVSISQHTATANLLPARSLCPPAVDSISGRQSCLKSPGLEETGRSSYCSGISLHRPCMLQTAVSASNQELPLMEGEKCHQPSLLAWWKSPELVRHVQIMKLFKKREQCNVMFIYTLYSFSSPWILFISKVPWLAGKER